VRGHERQNLGQGFLPEIRNAGEKFESLGKRGGEREKKGSDIYKEKKMETPVVLDRKKSNEREEMKGSDPETNKWEGASTRARLTLGS